MAKIRARFVDTVTGYTMSKDFVIDKPWERISPNDIRQLLNTGERLYGYALIRERSK